MESEPTCFVVLSHHLHFEAVLKVGQLGLNLLLGQSKLLDLTTLVLEFYMGSTLLCELNPEERNQNAWRD